ncbi:hypothetical protein B0H12DRAFT_1329780 [Mycena haematopus]|nr:hypothetical protein B0H12DRAFT_1329780 [Mycena haematopus]
MSLVGLPIELRREIFETAARADIGTALRLAVVSSWAQAWVEPIIYARVVAARNEHPTPLPIARPTDWIVAERMPTPTPKFIDSLRLSQRPPSFFVRHIKRVLLGYLYAHEVLTILSTCTGVTELGWWGASLGPVAGAAMGALPLRRLAVDFSLIIHDTPSYTALSSALAYLTHFDLSLVRGIPIALPFSTIPALLTGFPALTHFSLLYPAHLATHHTVTANTNAWADPVFAAAPRLCVFLLLCDSVYNEELNGLRPRSTDLRVVVRTSPRAGEGGYEYGPRWFHDAWPLADEIVRDRKRARALGKTAFE